MADAGALDVAIARAKAGDLPGVRAVLGLPPGEPPDDRLLATLRIGADALRLFLSGRSAGTADGLAQLGALLERSNDRQLAANVDTLAQIAEGLNALAQGDSATALAKLEPARQKLEALGFGDSDEAVATRAVARQLELQLAHARVKQAFASGELDEAEEWQGELRALGDAYLEQARADSTAEDSALGFVLGMRLEIAGALMPTDLEALDLLRAKARIRATAADEQRLRGVAERLEPPGQQVVTANLAVYDALSAMHDLAETLFLHRRTRARAEKRLVDSTRRRVEAVRDAGASVGTGGGGWIETSRRLARMLENWLLVGQQAKRSARKGSTLLHGLLFYALFAGLLALYAAKWHARGWVLAVVSLAALIGALIGAFSFDAVRFKPLLDSYAAGLKAGRGSGGAVNKAGTMESK